MEHGFFCVQVFVKMSDVFSFPRPAEVSTRMNYDSCSLRLQNLFGNIFSKFALMRSYLLQESMGFQMVGVFLDVASTSRETWSQWKCLTLLRA